MVGKWLLFCPVSSGYEWKLAAQPSSEYCWRGTAAFWHGIVQCFVFEISPFVTAGHIGGQSNAAFKADKSNSYSLGKFEIVFSHVLWTWEVGCDFPSSGWSRFSLYESGTVLIHSLGYQGGCLFFSTFFFLLFFLLLLSLFPFPPLTVLPSCSLAFLPAWK